MNSEIIKDIENKLKMNNISIDEVKQDEVDEIDSIEYEYEKESKDRIIGFLLKTKNPYLFKVDNHIVKIEFSDNGKSINDCLTKALLDEFNE